MLIVSVTSNSRALPHPGDFPIREWKAAGLLKPSLAQTKIATIEATFIRRKLGALAAGDRETLDAGSTAPCIRLEPYARRAFSHQRSAISKNKKLTAES